MHIVSDWLKALLAGVTTVVLTTVAFNSLGGGQNLLVVPILPVILGAIAAKWFLSGGTWGEATCPRCGAPQSPLRRPTSLKQTMLGGYTCNTCRAEINRFGDAES